MADLVITASAVIPNTSVTGATPIKQTGAAGETITAGQSVYLKASDGLIWLADANASSATAAAVGISLHAALAGQPITYQSGGALSFGAILVAGKYYVVSATAGGIAPVADLTTTWYSTLLMYGYTTSVAIIDLNATGVVVV